MVRCAAAAQPKRPARTGWTERSLTVFLQVWRVGLHRFKGVADWLQKQRIEAERRNAGQRQAVKDIWG